MGNSSNTGGNTPHRLALTRPVSVERALAESTALTARSSDPDPGHTLWVGFSGGVDSTVLLHAVRKIPGTVAIHIDHGLDPAAPQWVRHCKAVAHGFGVAFESRAVRVDRAGNRERAARTARYRVWAGLLGAGDLLALGHHADDQAETRVWQLLTGREPGGMPTERRLGDGRLVRPLLGVRRREILDYASRHDLGWIEDPSNADLDFDRNLIRHRLIPRLEARYPGTVERLAARRRQPVECLRALPVADADEGGAEAWLLAAGLPTPATVVAELERQSRAAADRIPCIRVVPGISARRYNDAWHLVRDGVQAAAAGVAEAVVGRDLDLPHGTLSWKRAGLGLPAGLTLSIRHRRGGERIRPVRRNRAKTVKALFQEGRTPPWLRADWPLLYDGKNLVAVPGLAVAVQASVTGGCEPHWSPRR